MKKVWIILLAFAILLIAVFGVSADQNGNDKWCNVDEYGCWVTDEGGNKSYINFWSENSRKYIMGDISEPGTLVVAPLPDFGKPGSEIFTTSIELSVVEEPIFIVAEIPNAVEIIDKANDVPPSNKG